MPFTKKSGSSHVGDRSLLVYVNLEKYFSSGMALLSLRSTRTVICNQSALCDLSPCTRDADGVCVMNELLACADSALAEPCPLTMVRVLRLDMS